MTRPSTGCRAGVQAPSSSLQSLPAVSPRPQGAMANATQVLMGLYEELVLHSFLFPFGRFESEFDAENIIAF